MSDFPTNPSRIQGPGAVADTRVVLSPAGRSGVETSFLAFRFAFRFQCKTQAACASGDPNERPSVDFTKLADRVSAASVRAVANGWERRGATKLFDSGLFSADVVALTEEDHDRTNPPPHIAGWLMSSRALRDRSGFGGDRGWNLVWGSQSEPSLQQFRILTVQLMLFDTGLGYLTFEIQPSSDALGAWHDVLHYFHFHDGRREVRLRPPSAVAGDRVAGSEAEFDLYSRIEDMLESIGTSYGFSESQRQRWWEPAERSGQLHAFGGVVLRDAPEDFEARHRILNRFAEMAHVGRALDPVGSDSETAVRERMQYNDRSWFTATKDVCLFVAFDPDRGRSPDFWLSQMPLHLRATYSVIDLFTQYQWHCIETIRTKTIEATSFLQRVSSDTSTQRLGSVRALQETVMAVRARGFFTEIARRRNHARFERFLRQVTRIDEMHRIAIDGAEAVGNWVVGEWEREERLRAEAARERREHGDDRRNQLLLILTTGTVASLPLQLVAAILSINIRGVTTANEGIGLLGVVVGVVASILFGAGVAIWFWRLHCPDDSA
jgi:hypothetical protein